MRFAVLHHLESAGAATSSAQIYAEVAEQVCAADRLGFDTAWVAEHHFSAERGRVPSPLLFLVHLAGQTRTIRLGSAVLPAPFYHPFRLAEDVALAATLLRGRLACGISSSGVADDMRAFQTPQEGKHERLYETLRWLREAWSGAPVGLPAPADAGGPSPLVRIVPELEPPIEDLVWVAASTAGAARIAGELGHHLLLPSLRPVESSAGHVAIYHEALAAGGGATSPRFIQNTFHLVVDQDHDRAMRLAEPLIWQYYERYVGGGAVQRLERETLPAVMARINFAAGGPEAVAEQVGCAARTLGLTHIAFQSRLIGLTPAQVMRGLELVMSDVAPRVEGVVGAT